jgi:hypothetical protein
MGRGGTDDILLVAQLLMAGWSDHGTRPGRACHVALCRKPGRWSGTDPLTLKCTDHAAKATRR